jgi:hypothetical protein
MGPEIGKGDDEGFGVIGQGIVTGVLGVYLVRSHSSAASTGGGDKEADAPDRL